MISFFKQHFPGEPLLVRAPGRVNLIGEHTDYNHGFVMPAAIDKGIDFAIAANGTDQIRLVSRDLNDRFDSPVSKIHVAPKEHSWANYILGMASLLQEKGYQIEGFDMAFGGNIPVGAGLSSSAALECGSGWAIARLFDLPIQRMELALMAQKAEHTWAGVMCGIMDQFASTFGKPEQVIQLDCRSLEYAYYPFSTTSYQLVLCDTGVSHSLASSEYNTRREECEAGVAIMQKSHPEVKALRDADPAMVQAHQHQMPPKVFDRCSFIVAENQRVIDASAALEASDLQAFGALMYASHDGLQHLYEVSCPELDFLVDQTRDDELVPGSRMMGGGFGGCTINLVPNEYVEDFTARMKQAYADTFGLELKVYTARISDGVNQL